MEACGTAHFWGRHAEKHGHRVVLLPPHAVRPYVAWNKTDAGDAKALLEAVRNQAIRPVPLKSIDQHVLASLHRLRSAWMATRTARLNTPRGLLRELGFVIPVESREVVPHVRALVLDGESAVPHALRPALAEAAEEIRGLEQRIREVERSLPGRDPGADDGSRRAPGPARGSDPRGAMPSSRAPPRGGRARARWSRRAPRTTGRRNGTGAPSPLRPGGSRGPHRAHSLKKSARGRPVAS
jgi:hypothetical protein